VGERPNLNHVALSQLGKRLSDRNINPRPGHAFGMSLFNRDNDPCPIGEDSKENSEKDSPNPAIIVSEFTRMSNTPASTINAEKSVSPKVLKESAEV
jgi:hypothetical protein